MLIWAGLFLLLLAARLHLVAKTALNMPFWDEWDTELVAIFLPPANGLPNLGAVLASHMEHRIVMTRLLDLALFWIQGRRWDILTGMIVNQVFFSLFAIALIARLSRGLQFLPGAILATLGLLVVINPFGWQAITWGFESAIYFCIILSVLSFALISTSAPDRGVFWLGILAACLACLSFGAGLATLLAVSALIAARHLPGPHRNRACAAIAVLLTAFVAIAATMPHGNDLNFRHPITQMATVMLRVMSWPERHARGLVYLPSALLILRGSLNPRYRTGLFWFAATFDVWQFMLAAQIAIGRFDDPISSRYTEILVVGIVINLACLMHLCQHAMGHPGAYTTWKTGVAIGAASLWIGIMAAAFPGLKPQLDSDLKFKRDQDNQQAFNVARFLKTNDPRFVLPPANIPYHTPWLLAQRLQEGAAAGIFPPALRDGDTPRRDKWRKNLARAATILALAGLAALLAGMAGLRESGRRPPAGSKPALP